VVVAVAAPRAAAVAAAGVHVRAEGRHRRRQAMGLPAVFAPGWRESVIRPG